MKTLICLFILCTISLSITAQFRIVKENNSPVISHTDSYTITQDLLVDLQTWQPVNGTTPYLPRRIVFRGDTLQVEFRETYIYIAPGGKRYPSYAYRYTTLDTQPAQISRGELKSILDRLQKVEQRPK